MKALETGLAQTWVAQDGCCKIIQYIDGEERRPGNIKEERWPTEQSRQDTRKAQRGHREQDDPYETDKQLPHSLKQPAETGMA